jgi:hypothetical protein
VNFVIFPVFISHLKQQSFTFSGNCHRLLFQECTCCFRTCHIFAVHWFLYCLFSQTLTLLCNTHHYPSAFTNMRLKTVVSQLKLVEISGRTANTSLSVRWTEKVYVQSICHAYWSPVSCLSFPYFAAIFFTHLLLTLFYPAAISVTDFLLILSLFCCHICHEPPPYPYLAAILLPHLPVILSLPCCNIDHLSPAYP